MSLEGEGAGATADEVLASLASASVDDILQLLCAHTGLEVAFVGQFSGGRRIIRYAAGSGAQATLLVRRDDDVIDSYCRYIAERSGPSLLADVHSVPELQRLDVTAELDIAAYVGAPIRLASGELYGTLCCIGHEPVDGFGAAVPEVLAFAAACVARHLERPEHRYVDVLGQQDRIRALLDDPDGLHTVFQPIVDLTSDEPVGYEALSRFPGNESESPAVWFADAHHVGLGIELELAAVRRALGEMPPAGRYLALNTSGSALDSPDLWAMLDDVDPSEVLLELTEGEIVDDAAMIERRRAIADRGIRLAVDDLGTGFSSLSRLLELTPDVVKFDRFLTVGIATDPRRRALAAAAVRLCDEMGMTLIAEGVEKPEDLDVLAELGFRYVQGYLTARPAPADW